MTRRLIGFIALISLASTACAGWLANQGQTPACVATYINVAPGLQVGLDGCKNSWVRFTETDQCFILSAAGDSMIEINCPAQGETLAVAK